MAVLRTMNSNDEIIKADSIIIKTMEFNYNRLNESYLKSLGLNEKLKDENSILRTEKRAVELKLNRTNTIVKVGIGVIIVETILYILK